MIFDIVILTSSFYLGLNRLVTFFGCSQVIKNYKKVIKSTKYVCIVIGNKRVKVC